MSAALDLHEELLTVLVVDDDETNIQAVVSYLRKSPLNLKILSAVGGEPALEICKTSPPDLILMDWDMPGIDGIETLKRLKARTETADIPVVMMTGKMTSSDNMQEAFDAGAADFLHKPIVNHELILRVRTIANLLNSYRKIKEQNKEIRDG
ncbi:MAG: response regulator, partial [Bacteroidia bacterium]|nr:response regulator [Bacteroidia bacterium]